MKWNRKVVYSVDNKVISRIFGMGRGSVFTPLNFSDLGNRAAVATTLKRYKQAGIIRQVARGIYDYPRQDPQFGTLLPAPDAVAKALAGRDAVKLQPTGAYAANLLGLSDQVPMKVAYLTNGRPRTVRFGRQQIILRQTTPRNMAAAGRISGTVIQALRHIGRRHVDARAISILRRKLSAADKKSLLKDLRYAPAWIADILRNLATEDSAAP
jgi:hypothetical protein